MTPNALAKAIRDLPKHGAIEEGVQLVIFFSALSAAKDREAWLAFRETSLKFIASVTITLKGTDAHLKRDQAVIEKEVFRITIRKASVARRSAIVFSRIPRTMRM